MYRIGHRVFRRKRFIIISSVLVIFFIGLPAFFIIRDLQKNNDTSSSSGATIVQVQQSQVSHMHVDEPLFGIDLPRDWKQVDSQSSPVHYIEWRGGTAPTSPISLKLYIDTIPKTQAVNRLLPVSAQGNRLVLGTLSDNCSSFAGNSELTPQLASQAAPTKAKWQQVDFICDLPNYLRNITGTGSVGAVNSVSVSGANDNTHKYFFYYTDHTAHPDDSIIIDIVQSFRAK